MQRSLFIWLVLGICLAVGAPLRAQDGTDALPRNQEERPARSVTALLALDARQVTRLDRIYETFARTRLEQEAKLAPLQERLKRIQEWTVPDERESARLLRDIKNAEERIASAFLRARSDALRVLTAGQRDELDALRAGTTRVQEDRYHQLFFLTVEDFWKVPVDEATARYLLEARSYAVRAPRPYPYDRYPGYGYRPYGYGYSTLYFDSHHFGGALGAHFGGGSVDLHLGGGHLGGGHLGGGHLGGGHH